jgi:hypothetical protein
MSIAGSGVGFDLGAAAMQTGMKRNRRAERRSVFMAFMLEW